MKALYESDVIAMTRSVSPNKEWEAIQAVMAYTLMESVGCTPERALAAIERQYQAAAGEEVTASNVLDHLLAAKLDLIDDEIEDMSNPLRRSTDA